MRGTFLQATKAGLFSLVFACIGVLVLALFAQLFTLDGTALPIINMVVKIIAVVLGTAIFVRDEKFLPKSLFAALVFWVVSQILFCILGGSFEWGQFFLDLAIAVAASLIVAIVKSKKA